MHSVICYCHLLLTDGKQMAKGNERRNYKSGGEVPPLIYSFRLWPDLFCPVTDLYQCPSVIKVYRTSYL